MVVATSADAGPEADGRHARRFQNREAVLDALTSLFADGSFSPSAAEIAARAGLSPRSLFRYFEDTDDLNRAAIERQLRLAAPLVDPGIDPAEWAPLKVSALASARVRLFEAIAPSARAARVCAHRHPVVRDQLRRDRSFLRRQLAVVFEPELDQVRGTILNGLDVLYSFETYDLLRVDQGLSRPKTTAAITTAGLALLSC